MVPALWFPGLLRNTLGYSTHARVSLPVLNPKTGINRDFDSFQLMDHHNDMRSMLPTMKFDTARPSFYLLNIGETHYPYAQARRGQLDVAAHQRGQRRVQEDGRSRSTRRAT